MLVTYTHITNNTHSNFRKEECAKIAALLKACYLLQNNMILEDKLGLLQSRFILIGSVAEGTRLDKANEIDVTIKFDALANWPMTFKAPEYLLKVSGESPLARFSTGGVYNHTTFLKYFLETIQSSLQRAMKHPEWPENLSPGTMKWEPCQKCEQVSRDKRESCYSPLYHCQDCLPAVVHSKAGPCLIFKWKQETPMTMDLIPVFPVRGGDDTGILSLFNVVTNYLLEKKPPQWAKHLKGIIERDRILPESLALQVRHSDGSNNTFDVSIKLLNYHPELNYVIRPGQGLSTRELRTNTVLRDVYIHVKTLKSLWSVDVKSYVIKKIILSESMKSKILRQDLHMQERLFAVLSHPELKKKFDQNIYFSKWEDDIKTKQKSQIWDDDDEIPSSYINVRKKKSM